jgi:hypothetical protein
MPRMQQRRDTQTNWTSANPVLASGEFGVETDTGRFKVGDGVSAWSQLLYVGFVTSVNGLTGNVELAAVASINSLSGSITITGGDNVTVSSSGSKITIDSPGAVLSVAGRTGVVSLTTADITDFNSEDYGKVSSVNGQTGTVTLVAASVSAASAVHATQHMAGGSDLVLPVIATATVSGTANNFLPGSGDIILLTNTQTAAATITGLSGGVGGAVRLLHNVSTNTINIASESTNSVTTNRFTIVSGDVTLGSDDSASVYYDSASGRWRIMSRSGSAGAVVAVNGQTGFVSLVAADVSAASADHTHVVANITDFAAGVAANESVSSVNGQTGTVVLSVASVPVTSTVSISTSQNNWSLTDSDVIYASSGSTNALNITGIATAAGNFSKLVINVSTHTSSSMILKHADTNSTSLSRLLVPWAGDYVMSPNGGAALVVRSEDDTRWRVV